MFQMRNVPLIIYRYFNSITNIQINFLKIPLTKSKNKFISHLENTINIV